MKHIKKQIEDEHTRIADMDRDFLENEIYKRINENIAAQKVQRKGIRRLIVSAAALCVISAVIIGSVFVIKRENNYLDNYETKKSDIEQVNVNLTNTQFVGDFSVTINKNVAFINGKRIVQDTPKSEAGNRIIPIPADICRELKEIQTENLFPCTYNAAKKALEKIAKGLDIKMTLHTFRHTYATRLKEAGIPAKVKQYLFGHASLEMTQNTYTDIQTAYIAFQIR